MAQVLRVAEEFTVSSSPIFHSGVTSDSDKANFMSIISNQGIRPKWAKFYSRTAVRTKDTEMPSHRITRQLKHRDETMIKRGK
jgi:hypothetical protein